MIWGPLQGVRVTRSGYAGWVGLPGNKAKQKQAEPRNRERQSSGVSSGSLDLNKSEAKCTWALFIYKR